MPLDHDSHDHTCSCESKSIETDQPSVSVSTADTHTDQHSWDTFYDLLMNDPEISYISDEAMTADSGRSYQELTTLMPMWGYMLHAAGNILPEDELSLIFKYGLLLWYVKYFLNKPLNMIVMLDKITDDAAIRDIELTHDPEIHEHETHKLTDPETKDSVMKSTQEQTDLDINFYDFTQYVELCKTYLIPVPTVFKQLSQHPSYQQILASSNYKYPSFKTYIIGMGLLAEYKHMIDAIVSAKDNILLESFDITNLFCDHVKGSKSLHVIDDAETRRVIINKIKLLFKPTQEAPQEMKSDPSNDEKKQPPQNRQYLSRIEIMEHVIKTDPIILRLGIIFQRWKIVAEKLISLCTARARCATKSVTKGTANNTVIVSDAPGQTLTKPIHDDAETEDEKKWMRNIIVIDRVLTRIQEMIFYRTRSICMQVLHKLLGIDSSDQCDCMKIREQNIYDLEMPISKSCDARRDETDSQPLRELDGKVYRIILELSQNPAFIMNRPQPIHYLVDFDVTELLSVKP